MLTYKVYQHGAQDWRVSVFRDERLVRVSVAVRTADEANLIAYSSAAANDGKVVA